MVILGKPSSVENYIIVNSDISYKLHRLGFCPLFRDGGQFYYVKTPELENIMKGGNIVAKESTICIE